MIHARATRDRLLPCLLVWLAFCLRVYHLDFQSLWRDEVDVLRFATRPAHEAVALLRQPGENGPLFYLLLRPWLAAAGQTEFALRFPSAWAGTAAVVLLYALARRLVGPIPALLAALFAATAPFLTWYSQDAKMYALITALIVLILWLTIEAVRRGGLTCWGALYLLTSASLLIHLLAALALPVQALWLLILAGRQGAARRRATMAYGALLGLPYLALLGWTARLWLARADPERYPFVPLFDMLALLAARFSQGALPGAPLALLPALLALVAGLFLGSQYLGRLRPGQETPLSHAERVNGSTPAVASPQRSISRRTIRPFAGVSLRHIFAGQPAQGDTPAPTVEHIRPGHEPGLLLAVWLIAPLLALYGISLRVPMFLDRYVIWTMPAFLALAGLGAAALLRAWRPLGHVVVGAIVALNLTGVWTQASRPIKSDFRGAAQFVAAHAQPGDRLIFQMPYNHYIFSYYYGALPGGWVDGPYTNGGLPAAGVDVYLTQGLGAAPAAWLIASEAPLWDRAGLTQAWLEGHGAVTVQAALTRVTVTRYRLGAGEVDGVTR